MKTYVHTQKGIKATVIEEKEFAVILEMEDTKEQKEMSLNTLKRWWKMVEDDSNASQIVPDESEQVKEANTTAETIVSDMDVQGASDLNGAESAKAEPMKMSETVAALEILFDKLNQIYFESKLSKPVITIQSTPKAYGHCSTKKNLEIRKIGNA